MIKCDLQTHLFRYIRHRASGNLSVADIALAVEHALQHQDIPILWVLEGVDSAAVADFEDQLKQLVDRRQLRASTRRRAFLVG